MDTPTKTNIPLINLLDGNHIPQVGYGMWQVSEDKATDLVLTAIDAGYTSIDTAMIYYNEAELGKALKKSSVPRDDLFITTKLWNDSHSVDKTKVAFDESMKLLGLDTLDLYLIHWPAPEQNLYVDAWSSLIELQSEGKIKSIGVSNFHIPHLENIITKTNVSPVINQIELHPYFQQRELKRWCEDNSIVVEAWSPLGRGGELLDDPVIKSIAQELKRSPAQVVLRWHIQHGNVVIPKSANPARIKENIDVFSFQLSPQQMMSINSLDRGSSGRIGPNPDTANF